MPTPNPAEFLQAAVAHTIIAEARNGSLALVVDGELACVLQPGIAGVSLEKGYSDTKAPTRLKVYSNEGPGPTFDFPLAGLSWAEAEMIASAVCEAFERVTG